MNQVAETEVTIGADDGDDGGDEDNDDVGVPDGTQIVTLEAGTRQAADLAQQLAGVRLLFYTSL